MKSVNFTICILTILFTLNGCLLSSSYKEGLLVSNGPLSSQTLNKQAVANIAKNSKDIIDYCNNIHTNKPEVEFDDRYKEQHTLTGRFSYDGYLDTDFYTTYCGAKNGKLMESHYGGLIVANSKAAGLGRRILSCEINDKIESVMTSVIYDYDTKSFPYETQVYFGNESYLSDFIKSNKLYGYESSNKMIVFPSSLVSNYENNEEISVTRFSVLFNYENNSKKPVDINLFNSYLVIDGAKYDLGFERDKNGNDFIHWTFYQGGKKSSGVLPKNMAQLRFNPGQKLTGEFSFKIPGKSEMTEDEIKTLEIYIDGIKCADFKPIDYHSRNKKPF